MTEFWSGVWSGYWLAMRIFAPGAILAVAVIYIARIIGGTACG